MRQECHLGIQTPIHSMPVDLMLFGKALGTACATFAITNIDNLFVLVTFYSETSTSKTMTPSAIAIGQCLGFTVIVAFSMTGYAVAFVLPTEPIGFLGLLPILLGIWKVIELLLPAKDIGGLETRGMSAGNRSGSAFGPHLKSRPSRS